MSKLNIAQFRAQMIAKAQAKAASSNQAELDKLQQELLTKKQEYAGVLGIKKEVLEVLASNPLTTKIQEVAAQVAATEQQSLAVMAEIESLVEGGETVVKTVQQPNPSAMVLTEQPEPTKEVRSEVVPSGGKSTDGEKFSLGEEGNFILVIDDELEVDVELWINGEWVSNPALRPQGYEPKWYRIAD